MSIYVRAFRMNLQRLIDAGHISKTDLARKAGISRQALDLYLNTRAPRLDVVESIANACQISVVELISPPGSLHHMSIRTAISVMADCFAQLDRGKIPEELLRDPPPKKK